MEDTIEVCSGCGKMPRPIDRLEGYFVCTRCGSRATMEVRSDDYEHVVTELDTTFHQMSIKRKVEDASKDPIRPLRSKKKAVKKPTKKPRKAVKETVKKATKKKAARKPAKKAAKRTVKKTAKRKAAKKAVKKAKHVKKASRRKR